MTFSKHQLSGLIALSDFQLLLSLIEQPCECGTKLGLLPQITAQQTTLQLLDQMALGAKILTGTTTVLGLPLFSHVTHLIQGQVGQKYKPKEHAQASFAKPL